MKTFDQAGAIPYRIRDSQCEFLVVTSHSGKWIFPKGIVEPGDTAEQTALKEAREEAGVFGTLLPGAIGCYGDHKWQSECRVHMFLLEYSGDCEFWEEVGLRSRRWLSFTEAQRLIQKPELRQILEAASARLEGTLSLRLGEAHEKPMPPVET